MVTLRLLPRILVVDDSAFMRRLVSDVIIESGEFDVVGTARDGAHALQQVRELNPDLITLDVDMPGQDGLFALRQIMREAPRPVIMLSAGGADGGAEATLRALEYGAVDFVRKPAGAISLDIDTVREQLLAALRAALSTNRETLRHALRLRTPAGQSAMRELEAVTSPVDRVAASAAALAAALANGPAPADATSVAIDELRADASTEPSTDTSIDTSIDTSAPSVTAAWRRDFVSPAYVICVASSTGGPAALAQVLPALPRFTRAAVCIAQHMPTGFTRSMAHRLDEASHLSVREAAHGEPLRAGFAYVAPGGQHLRIGVVDGTPCCLLDTGPLRWGVRPAADHLFESAAATLGAATIGVVMTGMGCDGAEGLMAIRRAGGRGIVQDAPSSVVDGMPMSALRLAGAEHVVPLEALAQTIASVATAYDLAPRPTRFSMSPPPTDTPTDAPTDIPTDAPTDAPTDGMRDASTDTVTDTVPDMAADTVLDDPTDTSANIHGMALPR